MKNAEILLIEAEINKMINWAAKPKNFLQERIFKFPKTINVTLLCNYFSANYKYSAGGYEFGIMQLVNCNSVQVYWTDMLSYMTRRFGEDKVWHITQ